MRFDVERDWKWADLHMDAIRKCLLENVECAFRVLDMSGTRDDLKLATDVIVMSTDRGRIAVRIRRNRYYGKWRDLTLRARRRSGTETELAKIKAGACDWYLYGWSDGNVPEDTRGNLIDWLLVDLNELRRTDLLDDSRIIWNDNGRTGFIQISDLDLRQSECLVAEMPDAPLATHVWAGQCTACGQAVSGGGIGYKPPNPNDTVYCLTCYARWIVPGTFSPQAWG